MTVGESSQSVRPSVGDGLRIASQAICYAFFPDGRVTAQQRPIVNTFLHLSTSLSVPSPCATAKDIEDKRWEES